MSEVKDQKEYTMVTQKIFERVHEYENDVVASRPIGESEILKGITIFEDVLEEINPSTLDDDVVALVEDKVYNVVSEKEEKSQRVSTYMHDGIYRCLLIVDVYNNLIKDEKNNSVRHIKKRKR